MDSRPCSEQVRLSQAIAQAVEDVDAAKAHRDRAVSKKQDVEPYSNTLAERRKQARRLVAEIDQHRREHAHDALTVTPVPADPTAINRPSPGATTTAFIMFLLVPNLGQ